MDYMKKVLLVSPLSPPVGGIATWSSNSIDFLRKRNSGIELLHFNSAMSRNRITNRNQLRRFVYALWDVYCQIVGIIRIFKKETPDVVHLTSSASLSLFKDYILLWYLQKFKIKTVLHFHFGRIPKLKNINNWEWKMMLKTIKKASNCIVLDSQSCATLKKEGFNNIIILPNSVNFQTNDCDKKKNLKDIRHHGSILFVGHVVLEKGVFELVEAVRDLDAVKELIFIGPFENDIRKDLIRIAGINHNKIKFMGFKSSDEVLYEMRKCAVFVLPSYSEGFPFVVLEAMSCACPIISTSVGGINDLLNNKCGILIKPKSVNELRTSISKLILNEKISKRLGENAFKFAKRKFNNELIMNQLIDVWLQNK